MFTRFRISRAGSLLFAGLLTASSLAQASTFSNLFFFGDSITDSGNSALLNSPPGTSPTGNPPSRSPSPYPDVGSDGFVYTPVYIPPWNRPYQGSETASNDVTWATYFGDALGLPGAALPSGAGGNNYAVMGATLGPDASPPPTPPTLPAQLAQFRQTHGGGSGTFDPGALYVIGGGANDIGEVVRGNLSPEAAAAGILGGLTAMVTSLRSWGAQQIVVWQTPDVTQTPAVQAAVLAGLISPEQLLGLRGLVDIINEQIENFDTIPGVEVFPLSDLLRDIVANPAAFGLADASTPCGYLPVYAVTGGQCTDSFLFWDGQHPTSAGQRLLASNMIALVPEPGVILLLAVSGIGLAASRRLARG